MRRRAARADRSASRQPRDQATDRSVGFPVGALAVAVGLDGGDRAAHGGVRPGHGPVGLALHPGDPERGVRRGVGVARVAGVVPLVVEVAHVLPRHPTTSDREPELVIGRAEAGPVRRPGEDHLGARDAVVGALDDEVLLVAVVVEDQVVVAVLVEVVVVLGVVVQAGRAQRDPAARGGRTQDLLGVVADEPVADAEVAALGELVADRGRQVVTATPAHGVHRQGEAGARDSPGAVGRDALDLAQHVEDEVVLRTGQLRERPDRVLVDGVVADRAERRPAEEAGRTALVEVLLHVVEQRHVLPEQDVVAGAEVEVVPLVQGGVEHHVRRSDGDDVPRLPGLREGVELRVQVVELVLRAAAARPHL